MNKITDAQFLDFEMLIFTSRTVFIWQKWNDAVGEGGTDGVVTNKTWCL